VLRSVNLEDAGTMLKKVLKMDNAWVIRNYMDDQLRKAGLGQLLR
jgi:hypothetical protein